LAGPDLRPSRPDHFNEAVHLAQHHPATAPPRPPPWPPGLPALRVAAGRGRLPAHLPARPLPPPPPPPAPPLGRERPQPAPEGRRGAHPRRGADRPLERSPLLALA